MSAVPPAAPAVAFKHVSSVPAGWGPISIPEHMTMTLHEALEILDPFNKMPHDLYSILAYASLAHPDVGQMLDRFARAQHDATVAELERIQKYTEAARRASGLPAGGGGGGGGASHFAPIDLTGEAAAILGMEKPQGLIELEQKERAAQEAAVKAQRAKMALAREKRRQKGPTSTATALSSFVKPGEDKDFEYLVRKAEEELGWTGKYDEENNPKPKYSRASLRKEVSFWVNKATEVRDNLRWMQKQLIKELEIEGASFGTKKNATIASMDILRAIVVDKSEIGKNLREFWFDPFAANFQKMIIRLSEEERKKFRTSAPKGKFIRDMKKLIRQHRKQKLNSGLVESALLLVDPKAKISKNNAEEESEDEDSSSGSEGEESGEAESSGEKGDEDEEEDEQESGEEDAEGEEDQEDEEESSSDDDSSDDESIAA